MLEWNSGLGVKVQVVGSIEAVEVVPIVKVDWKSPDGSRFHVDL